MASYFAVMHGNALLIYSLRLMLNEGLRFSGCNLDGKHSSRGHLTLQTFSLCTAEIEHLTDLKNGWEISGHLAVDHKHAVQVEQLCWDARVCESGCVGNIHTCCLSTLLGMRGSRTIAFSCSASLSSTTALMMAPVDVQTLCASVCVKACTQHQPHRVGLPALMNVMPFFTNTACRVRANAARYSCPSSAALTESLCARKTIPFAHSVVDGPPHVRPWMSGASAPSAPPFARFAKRCRARAQQCRQ